MGAGWESGGRLRRERRGPAGRVGRGPGILFEMGTIDAHERMGCLSMALDVKIEMSRTCAFKSPLKNLRRPLFNMLPVNVTSHTGCGQNARPTHVPGIYNIVYLYTYKFL